MLSRRMIIGAAVTLALLGAAGYAHLNPAFAASCKTAYDTSAGWVRQQAEAAVSSFKRTEYYASVTQEMRVIETRKQAADAALAERVPAAYSKKDDALAGGGRKCRYCGKPIQPQALYCGFCGKSVATPAKEPVESQKQSTIRLKPIQENSTASAKPAAIHLKPIRLKPPANGKPAAASPRPRSASGRWYTSWGGNVRMVISLCLLAFLGYYAYQKIKYDHDVIISIKAASIRAVQSVQEKSLMGLQGGAQWSHRLLWARFMTKPAPPVDLPEAAPKVPPALPVDLPTVAPKATPIPDQPAAPAELSKLEAEAVPKSKLSPAPAVATEPKATETAVSATPAPVPLETPPPPAASEPPKPKPEPATAPVKSPQDVEYERILQTCKQQQPKAGDRITLRFKNDRQPVEGVLEQTTAEGVKVKVSAGVIEYPLRLVAEENRLMLFPEERARRIQSQQVKKSE